jgi:uracil-DNA glycosylase family 4
MERKEKLKLLNSVIIECRHCPRLVAFRESVPPRASYKDFPYWRRPVPGFGDANAWLLLVGLAPAAHGGNRTGRIFTGDQSSRFLINALYEEGFANQPTSEYRDDGLQLVGCYMTPVVKCAPPKDKPTAEECRTCLPYFKDELKLLPQVRHILALGKTAFDGFLRAVGQPMKGYSFGHGVRYALEGLPVLWGSYHPSPQNTNTGRLTHAMFCEVLQRIKESNEEKKVT